MKSVSIALLGCGTVGKGVVDLLAMNGPLIEEQLDTKINIKRILIRDLNKYEKMEGLPDSIRLTTDFNDIINDDEIEIVVEVMGSADFAKDCIEQCFRRGKSVISANKDLIADYGIPLLTLSYEHDVDFQFEASVAGGIPIVRPMYSSLNSNRIEEIIGIMNGTTNFILSNMTAHGSSYEEVLKEAQEKGYAEADPTNDVSGYDAARKIAILATLGFHSAVTFDDVAVEALKISPRKILNMRRKWDTSSSSWPLPVRTTTVFHSTSIRPLFVKTIPWPMSTAPIMPFASAATALATSCSTARVPDRFRRPVLSSVTS